MAEYIEKSWKEITSRNPVKGALFPQGLKDFKFSIGQGYGLIPSQSYFKVDLKLNAGSAGGAIAPTLAESATFADGVCGNLFNNIYFNMGGQTVSSITSGLPQCDILKNRLTKSSTYNATIGKTQGFLAHHADRANDLLSDSTDPNAKDTKGRNTKSFVWQPALGIMDVSQPLGAGEYDIQLNPSQDYQKAAIDTFNDSAAPDGKELGAASGQVELEVVDIRFYACVVRVNLPSSGVETLHLMEMMVQTANVDTGGGEINEEVSVPSSTRALTLFVQDQQAGKTTSVPPSKFHIAGANANKNAIAVTDYQIEYAGMTKPTVRYSSDYSPGVMTIQQRYINSALESGQYFNPSGFETLNEYLERGPFFHESFVKSADNLATRAHVVANYKNPFDQAARLFVVAHYSRTIQITRQHGLIVDLRSLNV